MKEHKKSMTVITKFGQGFSDTNTKTGHLYVRLNHAKSFEEKEH